MDNIIIRPAHTDDATGILELYIRVADVPGGLARLRSEVDLAYIESFLHKALEHGLTFVATSEDGDIVGEIHAYTPGIYCFSHVFTDLTIAVDPDAQGRGVGRQLFERFMVAVESERTDIRRVELIARESNAKAIRFYESLGFKVEGELVSRIRNVDGSFESDIPMAWTRG